MPEWSGPWDGTSLGDAALIAPYNAAEWATIWRSLIQSGSVNEGVLVGSGIAPDTGLTVQETTPAAAAVEVTPGSAIVYGSWYQIYGLVAIPLVIDPNVSGNPRIDRIVVRADYALQTIRLVVLKGTPAGSPVAPSLTQTAGVKWEIPLAQIAVANGFATITNANITPEWAPGGAAEGVYLSHVLNRSGADLTTGDVVVWDSTAVRSVKTDTVVGASVAGVWVGFTANGGYGRVLVNGIIPVKTTGAIAIGKYLRHSNTAKTASETTLSYENSFALTLGTAANGYTLCRVEIPIEQLKFNTTLCYVPVGVYQDNSGNWVDVDGTNVKISGYSHSGRIKVTFLFSGLIINGNTGCYRIKNQTTGAVSGDAAQGLACTRSNSFEHITATWIFSLLTPGTTYEFRLQMKSLLGTDNVEIVNSPIVMMAEEV